MLQRRVRKRLEVECGKNKTVTFCLSKSWSLKMEWGNLVEWQAACLLPLWHYACFWAFPSRSLLIVYVRSFSLQVAASVPASAAVVNMNPLSVLTSMVLSLYGEHTQLLWQCKHKHMLRSSEWFLCAAKHRECLHPNSFAKGGWDYLTFKLFYKYYGNQDLFWVTPRLSRYKRQILWS